MEAAAWCFLGVPGLLYCAWRYLARAHVCAACGSGELIREARASRRATRYELRALRPRRSGRAPWPPALVDPLWRLRGGSALALAGLAALALAASGLLDAGVPSWGPASGLWSASWVFAQIALFHDVPPPGRAWREDGTPLRVEWLGAPGR